MCISIFNNIIIKMEGQPLIYNKNYLNLINAIVRFFDRECYRFIINFRYFIEVTTNFHRFMKLDVYSMPTLTNVITYSCIEYTSP
jgi:hypothetical protein